MHYTQKFVVYKMLKTLSIATCSLLFGAHLAYMQDMQGSQETKDADSTESAEQESRREGSHSHKTYEVQRAVVTGSALSSDVEKIPGNISTVDSNHVKNMNNNKITDTIKKLPGVRVDNDVSFNPRPQIKLRGIKYGTLVMLDGVILSDLEGEQRILNQISLYDVERVEVARGAFSSLYGAGAIGGVVNFITSMPTTFTSQAIIAYGNEFVPDTADKNLVRVYASVGDVFLDKRLRVKLSAGYTSSGGYPSFPTILPSGVATTGVSGIVTDKAGNKILGTGGDRNYNIYDTRLKAEYDLTDVSTISSMISFSSYNYRFDNFRSYLKDSSGNSTNLINGQDYFVGSGLGGMGTYSHVLGNLTYTHDFEEYGLLKASFSTMDLFSMWQDANQCTSSCTTSNMTSYGNSVGGPGYTQDIDSSSNYFDALYHLDLNEKHRLNTAVQFRYYKYTQKWRNIANWTDYNTRQDTYRSFGSDAFVASTYASLESQWIPTLSSTLGLRYDYWLNFNGYLNDTKNPTSNSTNQSTYASVFSPKASINYIPDFDILQGLVFKASIGTGFRMPTMREMYQFTHATTVWAINPNLKEEYALSMDVGVEYDNHGFTGSLYYYDLEVWDMLYQSGSGKQGNPYQYANAGRGRINGIELAFGVPIWGDLRLEGNYTLTLATILKNDAKPETVGKQLANTPKHMANIALNYFPKHGFYGSIWAYYAPAFYSDDINTPALTDTYGYYESQFTLNAKVGYNFNNSMDLSVSFNNITNNRYYDFYQVAGASFYLQLRYKL